MKFSLIIPIYNVEEFLPQCLDSVLNQDIALNEYEIICVIDGSPDNSIDIVREYQEKYSNIVLVEQENGGVCSARNHGIRLAKGEYVWFIDPDDFIVTNCLMYLYNKLKSSNYDTLRFDRTVIDENTVYKKDEYTIGKKYDNQNSSDNVCTMIIVKNEIYKKTGLTFNENLIFEEDTFFMFQLDFNKYNSILLKDEVMFVYRIREKSITNEITDANTLKKINSLIILAEAYKNEKSKFLNDIEKIKSINNRITNACQGALFIAFFKQRKSYKYTFYELKNKGLIPMKTNWYNFKYRKDMSIKHNLLATLEAYFSFTWFASFLKIFA